METTEGPAGFVMTGRAVGAVPDAKVGDEARADGVTLAVALGTTAGVVGFGTTSGGAPRSVVGVIVGSVGSSTSVAGDAPAVGWPSRGISTAAPSAKAPPRPIPTKSATLRLVFRAARVRLVVMGEIVPRPTVASGRVGEFGSDVRTVLATATALSGCGNAAAPPELSGACGAESRTSLSPSAVRRPDRNSLAEEKRPLTSRLAARSHQASNSAGSQGATFVGTGSGREQIARMSSPRFVERNGSVPVRHS